ncbi:hypothetical protein [Streptomyces phage phiScoe44]|nr:hypothetical protein [Streptomyces phage phiScoe44]
MIEFHEVNESETVEAGNRVDWDFGTAKGTPQQKVLHNVAVTYAEKYGSTLEYDDVIQEGQIFMSLRSDDAKMALALGPGALNRWLGQRLRDKFLPTAKGLSKHTSYEGSLEKYNPEVIGA